MQQSPSDLVSRITRVNHIISTCIDLNLFVIIGPSAIPNADRKKKKNNNSNMIDKMTSNYPRGLGGQQRTESVQGPRLRSSDKTPGPPLGPAPAHQPHKLPSVNLNKQSSVQKVSNKRFDVNFPELLPPQRSSRGKVDLSVLNVPDGGMSRSARQSMASEPAQQRPVPGGGRPRPKPRAVRSLPKVRALYDYEAADVDEITIKEGEVFELIQEREWQGHQSTL